MRNTEFDFTDSIELRKKAEERLQELEKVDSGSIEEADLKKVLHELQVHQIELEMQNEELVQAYESAEKTLKNYTILYDLAPAGFFILNEEASICDLNFTAADLLGDKRFTLLQRNFKLFVAKDSLQQFNHFLNEVYTTSGKITCELNLGYDNNPLGFVYMEGVVTGDDRKCLLSVINLSMIKNGV